MISFLSQQVTTRRHFMWNVLSFLTSFCAVVRVSAPYNSTDMTRVRNNLILVAIDFDRFALQNTFQPHI